MTQKNRHLRIIAQICRAVSAQLRYVSTIRKKMLSSQYGELRLPTAEIGFGLWAPQQRVSRLDFVTAATSLPGGQPNFA